MTKIATYTTFLLAAILNGCSSTGIVQTDGDKYMIAKKSPQVLSIPSFKQQKTP